MPPALAHLQAPQAPHDQSLQKTQKTRLNSGFELMNDIFFQIFFLL